MFKTIFKVLGGLIITVVIGSVAYISVTIPGGVGGFVGRGLGRCVSDFNSNTSLIIMKKYPCLLFSIRTSLIPEQPDT